MAALSCTARRASALLLWLLLVTLLDTAYAHDHRHHDHRDLNIFAKGGSDGLERRCGTPEPNVDELAAVQDLVEQYREGSRGADIPDSLLIPICFHVIYSSDGAGNLTTEDLQRQVDMINIAFSASSCCDETEDWCVPETCSLDSGIGFAWNQSCSTSTENDEWYVAEDRSPVEEEMMRALRQGGPEVLNIYFKDLTRSRILGFASFPWDYEAEPWKDGVVVWNIAISGGASTFYGEGDTLVHEIGHWLALFHTFAGGCVGEGLADTPPMASGSEGCPIGRDSCPGGGVDPVHNFLDYSDDVCLYEFTPMQITIMLVAHAVYRGDPFSRPTLSLSSTIPSEALALVEGDFQLFNYTADLSLADDVVCFSGTYNDPSGEPCTMDCGHTRLVLRWNAVPDPQGDDSDCVSESERSTSDICTVQPSPMESLLYVGLSAQSSTVDVQVTCADVTEVFDGTPSPTLVLESGELHVYKYVTASWQSDVTCSSTASSGNADMYVGLEVAGVLRRYNFECESAGTDSFEECTLAGFDTGTEIYLVMVAQDAVTDLVVTCVEIGIPFVPLEDGVVAAPLSLSFREQQPYIYNLENLEILVSVTCLTRGSSGDADLYLRWSEPPTLETYDCRGFTLSANEDCTVQSPSGATVLYVLVNAVTGFSQLSITCSETVIGSRSPSKQPSSQPVVSPSNLPSSSDQPSDLPSDFPSSTPSTPAPTVKSGKGMSKSSSSSSKKKGKGKKSDK